MVRGDGSARPAAHGVVQRDEGLSPSELAISNGACLPGSTPNRQESGQLKNHDAVAAAVAATRAPHIVDRVQVTGSKLRP
jgi:hypothetical protein